MGCYCGKKAYVIEKKEVEDKEKEKEYDSILNSKLLSGGLEEKHLKIFSKEKIDKMKKIVIFITYSYYNHEYSWQNLSCMKQSSI
jgi:hypothetical protein